MKIVTIIGARPQFIKTAMVSKAIDAFNNGVSKKSSCISEVIVHTKQHFDDNMSDLFFREMQIPAPAYCLDINCLGHGAMTGRMMEKIEIILLDEQADLLLVYGDTNSTLAGALAAAKLDIPIAHVEAGVRSFNRKMPEEHNRVLTDHCSDILLCPTQTAVDNLKREGIPDNDCRQKVSLVGDTMYDSILHYSGIAAEKSGILGKYGLKKDGYYLVTIHRPYNTDNEDKIHEIMNILTGLDLPVVFPVHPGTRKLMHKHGYLTSEKPGNNIITIDPVGYIDMITLERNSKIILTDSGGIQKEAYFLKIPCVTIRPETEWTETVDSGWNVLSELNAEAINKLVRHHNWPCSNTNGHFGDGNASEHIVNELLTYN